jgi:hypothetical protein
MLQGVSYDEAGEQMQGLQMQCIMAKGLHVVAISNQRAHDTFAWSSMCALVFRYKHSIVMKCICPAF